MRRKGRKKTPMANSPTHLALQLHAQTLHGVCVGCGCLSQRLITFLAHPLQRLGVLQKDTPNTFVC
jgi:hypothetical protein